MRDFQISVVQFLSTSQIRDSRGHLIHCLFLGMLFVHIWEDCMSVCTRACILGVVIQGL